MKKTAAALLAAFLLLASGSAFAETELSAICAANTCHVLMESFDSLSQASVYYDVNTGKEYAATFFNASRTAGAEEDFTVRYTLNYANGDTEVFTGGMGYGYNAELQTPYTMLFAADTYEKTILALAEGKSDDLAEGEILLSENTAPDGKLIVTTQCPTVELPYEADVTGKTMVYRYTLDPDTLVIAEFDAFVRGADGNEAQYLHSTLTYNEAYELPAEIAAIMEGEDAREVHVIMDYGTDDEFDYVFGAKLNVAASIILPDGYELYEDAACTGLFSGIVPDENGHYPLTQTIYAAPTVDWLEPRTDAGSGE